MYLSHARDTCATRVCMYVYTYVYVWTYVCMYVCSEISMHAVAYRSNGIRMCVLYDCMHASMYVCTYVCIFVPHRQAPRAVLFLSCCWWHRSTVQKGARCTSPYVRMVRVRACVHVCVCMYFFLYVCMHTCMDMSACLHMSMHVRVCMYVCMNVRMYACMYLCMLHTYVRLRISCGQSE